MVPIHMSVRCPNRAGAVNEVNGLSCPGPGPGARTMEQLWQQPRCDAEWHHPQHKLGVIDTRPNVSIEPTSHKNCPHIKTDTFRILTLVIIGFRLLETLFYELEDIWQMALGCSVLYYNYKRDNFGKIWIISYFYMSDWHSINEKHKKQLWTYQTKDIDRILGKCVYNWARLILLASLLH